MKDTSEFDQPVLGSAPMTFAGPLNLVRRFLERRTWLRPVGNKREQIPIFCVEFGVSCPRRGVDLADPTASIPG